MRSLVLFAVRRRVTILMVALAVIAFGYVGYQRLSLDLLPDISYPSLTVQTELPNAAPAEVENLVTRPVEEAVGVLKGLRNIHSVSRSGVSEVTLEFDWGSDMDLISMDVREKVDRLFLPDDAEDPVVLRFDPSLDPILRVAFTGPNDLASLRNIAEKKIKPELETILGVAAAEIKGGVEEEIQVEVIQGRLAALGVPLSRVRDVVGISNVNLPGGSLQDEQSQYLVRTVNEFDTVEEIGELILRQDERGLVRLRDVAEVRRGEKEREEITRVNGVEGVEIAVFKEGDANTVTAARDVRERLDELKESLPPEHDLAVLFDQSRFIEQSVREVRNAAGVGGLLAVIVLLVFLRRFSATVIIATSIPLSVIATFMVMYRADVSLNIMSLGGLTLGIGMLVDNSIVVLESIHRRRQEGLALVPAVVEGTTEVGSAVLASTLTTIAVFLPIVFVEGIAGQMFGDMSLTVTMSLLASLVVALTVIPMLSVVGKGSERGPEGEPGGPSLPPAPPVAGEEPVRTLGALSAGYERFLRGVLRMRWATIAIGFGAFAGAILAARTLDTELIPAISEGEFFFEATLPEGTPLAATDKVLALMEETAAADPEIERYYSTVGSRLVSGGLSLNTTGEHLGQLNVVLARRDDESAEARVAERLRERFEQIPDLDAQFGKPTYFSLSTPIEVVLYGDDLELLRDYSLDLAERIADLPGLVDVRSSLEAGSPELRVIFDRDRLASLGLDMRDLSETLHDRIEGVVPTRFKEEDRQIDIRIRNREEDRESRADVKNLVLTAPDGRTLRLTTIADVALDRGPAEIHRIQQQRAALVSANLAGRSLGSAVSAIQRTVEDVPPPSGLTLEIGGQNREMEVSFASLRFAIALAIFLVYLVMAATFESMVHPFVVLFTIPLALVGVVAGLLATGTPVSVIVLIGTIMLVGIVVNNAIVLVDKINQLRRAGVEKQDAVLRACSIRLRPIVMTTLTTVLALVPMALAVGQGAELRSPLAVTVSFGLVLSTLLTLVVIPAVYMVVPSTIRSSVPSLGTEPAAAEGAAT